jgi:hypothetical protein
VWRPAGARLRLERGRRQDARRGADEARQIALRRAERDHGQLDPVRLVRVELGRQPAQVVGVVGEVADQHDRRMTCALAELDAACELEPARDLRPARE